MLAQAQDKWQKNEDRITMKLNLDQAQLTTIKDFSMGTDSDASSKDKRALTIRSRNIEQSVEEPKMKFIPFKPSEPDLRPLFPTKPNSHKTLQKGSKNRTIGNIHSLETKTIQTSTQESALQKAETKEAESFYSSFNFITTKRCHESRSQTQEKTCEINIIDKSELRKHQIPALKNIADLSSSKQSYKFHDIKVYQSPSSTRQVEPISTHPPHKQEQSTIYTRKLAERLSKTIKNKSSQKLDVQSVKIPSLMKHSPLQIHQLPQRDPPPSVRKRIVTDRGDIDLSKSLTRVNSQPAKNSTLTNFFDSGIDKSTEITNPSSSRTYFAGIGRFTSIKKRSFYPNKNDDFYNSTFFSSIVNT